MGAFAMFERVEQHNHEVKVDQKLFYVKDKRKEGIVKGISEKEFNKLK